MIMKDDIKKIITEIEFQLMNWLDRKPTGFFRVTINANEGGIRDKPKLTIETDLLNK